MRRTSASSYPGSRTSSCALRAEHQHRHQRQHHLLLRMQVHYVSAVPRHTLSPRTAPSTPARTCTIDVQQSIDEGNAARWRGVVERRLVGTRATQDVSPRTGRSACWSSGSRREVAASTTSRCSRSADRRQRRLTPSTRRCCAARAAIAARGLDRCRTEVWDQHRVVGAR